MKIIKSEKPAKTELQRQCYSSVNQLKVLKEISERRSTNLDVETQLF